MGKEIGIVLWGIFHICSIIMSLQDVYMRMVHRSVFYVAILALCGLSFIEPINDHAFIGISIFLIAVLLTSFYKKQMVIAPADVSYAVLCLLFIDPFYAFILIGILSVFYYAISKKDIPFIAIFYFVFVVLIKNG